MVCPYDLSRPGGVQGQGRGLVRALRALGHDAWLIAPDDAPLGWAGEDRYVAGRSLGLRANGSVAPLCVSAMGARRAVGVARARGAQVVHLHEPFAPVLGYGFWAAHRWPTVATFHRSGSDALMAIASPLARWARGRIDVCVAVSEAARDTAATMCGGTYEVLFNGVDLGRYAGVVPTPSDVPAVLFLGRHESRKGLEVLLDAFAQVTRPAVLWIAGTGADTARLRARHPESERVRWLGVVSDDEAASRLLGAAVLCAPSLGGESFGMVLVEAMAAGTAVVASDISGYRQVAAGHGTLVAPGDRSALAVALDRLLASPPDAGTLERARQHAAQWSMDGLAARYVDLYRRAMARRPPAARIARMS